MQDYYKILEVTQEATQEDIKKSFKRLAKKYHPDINKGKANTEEKFKEISEAYEVLGREKERQKYDDARSGRGSFNFEGYSKEGPFGDYFHSSAGNSSTSDIFAEILKGFNLGSSKRGGSSSFGGFESLFSNRGSARPDTAATLKVPLSSALSGGKIQVSGLPGGSQTIDIPPGVANGAIIKANTPSGNYSLKLEIEDEHPFKIKGNHIETTIRVNIVQAVLGSKVKLKDPRNQDFIVTVPPGSQSGDTLRMRGLGLSSGDLLVKIEVIIPKTLDESEKQHFIELANRMNWRY